MDSELLKLELQIINLTKEIVVPLRSKEINEEAFLRLFQVIGLLFITLDSKEEISRKTAGWLFFLYTQLETQGSYATGAEIDPIRKKKAQLITYLRKVFGGVLENN